MSLDVFQSYIKGYSDHLFDLETLLVKAGFWAGYYSKAKRPKSYVRIIKGLIRNRLSGSRNEPKPDVDVEQFKAIEDRFWSAYSREVGGKHA